MDIELWFLHFSVKRPAQIDSRKPTSKWMDVEHKVIAEIKFEELNSFSGDSIEDTIGDAFKVIDGA